MSKIITKNNKYTIIAIVITVIIVVLCGIIKKNTLFSAKTEKEIKAALNKLEYTEIPEMPVLVMHLKKAPSYKMIEAPSEDLWGTTITNNKYECGDVVFYTKQRCEEYSGSVKVRGNSSNFRFDKEKLNYKIKLDEPAVLIGKTPYKEWNLINNGTNLNNMVGNYIASVVGVEIQVPSEYVNVILNGDWMGTYLISPTIDRNIATEYISEDGYLFENDLYWWKPNEPYFKTSHQSPQMGYTFKYPEISNSNDNQVKLLQDYMETVETAIISDSEDYSTYIDKESFAKWILVRDIVGNGDGGGANMYLYKYDFDEANPASSKIKLGPMWDFEHLYCFPDKWSNCRSEEVSLYPYLFKKESFANEYYRQWDLVKENLYKNVSCYISDLICAQGDALNESWAIDAKRWGIEDELSVEKEEEAILDWFAKRTDFINSKEMEINNKGSSH